MSSFPRCNKTYFIVDKGIFLPKQEKWKFGKNASRSSAILRVYKSVCADEVYGDGAHSQEDFGKAIKASDLLFANPLPEDLKKN